MSDKADEKVKTILTLTYVSIENEGHRSNVFGINKEIRIPEMFMSLVNKAIQDAVATYFDTEETITKLDDF